MKDVLRKGLDAFEDRRERRDEKLAEVVGRRVESMSHRPALKLYVSVLSAINLLFWAAVIIRPYDVLDAFEKTSNAGDKLVGVVLALVFGVGLWLSYSIFRLRYPDLEEQREGNEPMTAFANQENSTRKVRVWVISVAAGVLNLLALGVTLSLRVGE